MHFNDFDLDSVLQEYDRLSKEKGLDKKEARYLLPVDSVLGSDSIQEIDISEDFNKMAEKEREQLYGVVKDDNLLQDAHPEGDKKLEGIDAIDNLSVLEGLEGQQKRMLEIVNRETKAKTAELVKKMTVLATRLDAAGFTRLASRIDQQTSLLVRGQEFGEPVTPPGLMPELDYGVPTMPDKEMVVPVDRLQEQEEQEQDAQDDLVPRGTPGQNLPSTETYDVEVHTKGGDRIPEERMPARPRMTPPSMQMQPRSEDPGYQHSAKPGVKANQAMPTKEALYPEGLERKQRGPTVEFGEPTIRNLTPEEEAMMRREERIERNYSEGRVPSEKPMPQPQQAKKQTFQPHKGMLAVQKKINQILDQAGVKDMRVPETGYQGDKKTWQVVSDPRMGMGLKPGEDFKNYRQLLDKLEEVAQQSAVKREPAYVAPKPEAAPNTPRMGPGRQDVVPR